MRNELVIRFQPEEAIYAKASGGIAYKSQHYKSGRGLRRCTEGTSFKLEWSARLV